MLYSAQDLAVQEFPEETFLVEGLIPLGGLVLLHGKRGIGKSQFSMTLGHAITNGLPLFNKFSTTRGKVILVQIDMTPQLTQLRLQKLWGVYEMDGMYWWLEPSMDVKTWSKSHPLINHITELEPVLVVWDTLRKIHRMNENQSETAQAIYSAVKQYMPLPTHLFIHHDKKTQMDPNGELDPEEAFRGSTDWIDSVDTSIQLWEQGRGRLGLKFHKCRTMAEDERPQLLLEMDEETLFLLPHATNLAEIREIVRNSPFTSRKDAIHYLISRGVCTRRFAEQFTSHLLDK
jgi:hypothetical protein